MSHGYRVTGAISLMLAVDRPRGVRHEIDPEQYRSVSRWEISALGRQAGVPEDPSNSVEER